jgi:hypothetical protein
MNTDADTDGEAHLAGEKVLFRHRLPICVHLWLNCSFQDD